MLQPVGLFFASGADGSGHGFSVANPIQDVLSELEQTSHGEGLQIAGGAQHPVTCSNYDEHTAPVIAQRKLRRAWLLPQVGGPGSDGRVADQAGQWNPWHVSTGKSLDSPGEAAVIVYVDKNKSRGHVIPKVINGVRTMVIPTDAASMSAGALSPRLYPRWRAFIYLCRGAAERRCRSAAAICTPTDGRSGLLWSRV